MEGEKTVGFVFIDSFADWEFGLLSGSAVEWFGARAVALTPEERTVRSMAGFQLAGERGIAPHENDDLDAVALIGSDNWMSDAPDVGPLVNAVASRGGIVGAICGSTLALARAGLFAGRLHTSNGRDWIREFAPDYAGAEFYRDVPHAVADKGIISAPGSAPGTFAVAFLEALYPQRASTIGEMRGLFAREYVPA